MKQKEVALLALITIIINLFAFPVQANYTPTNEAYTLVDYLNNKVGESFASNRCQAFVYQSVGNAIGVWASQACAYEAWQAWGVSSSKDIPLGATVYFSGSSVKCGNHKAGHVGIYVGDGYIIHAASSKVQKTQISYIENYWSGYDYLGWGWNGGHSLATDDIEAPTINNLRVEDVSGESFTIKCDLNDNVGVTRVWLNIYGPGGNNGYAVSASNGSFSHQIKTSDYGGTGLYSVHVYAFDAAGNETVNKLSDINTIGDNESPVITRLYTSNVNSNSFKINCEVYDNVAVTRAWIIVWGPGGNSGNGYSISVHNNFSHTINTADYGGRGTYSVHVYVYDAQGNGTVAALNDIIAVSDAEAPVMCGIRPTNVSDKSFTIKCEVYDNIAVTRAWVIVWGPGGNSGNGYSISVFNNFSHTINTSDYGGAGWYSVHVYIFDDDGNQSVGAINNFYVGNDYSVPVVTDLSVTGISDSSFTINCTANEKIVRAWFNIYGPNGSDGYAVTMYDTKLMHTIDTSKYGGAGEYEVHVYMWDPSGNESSGMSTGRFVANKRFNVHFNANMGITTSSVQTVTYTDKYGSLPAATRTGYDFEGWYTSLAGGALITKDSYVTINDTHTLYARWKPKQYYLDVNGLLDNTSCSNISGYGTFDLYLNGILVGDDINDAYQLCDYGTLYTITDIKNSLGRSYNGSNVELSGTITNTTNIELQFITDQYMIAFDANGGTTSTPNKTVTYDSTYGTLPIPIRDGHSFKGWYTEADGGTEITDSTKVKITSEQTLYAHWQINDYTLTYNLNGGEGDISEVVCNYGTDIVITDAEPERDGYMFLGWSVDAEASEAEYRANDTYRINQDTVLYAVWMPVPKIVAEVNKYSSYAMCNVRIDNIDSDCMIIIAKYKGNKLVSTELRKYDGEEEIFPVFEDIDTVKIIAVENIEGLKPICKPASLNIG